MTKTRYEKMQEMTKESLARYLCDLCADCDECPVRKKCAVGKNGYIAWLEEVCDD